MNFHNKLMRGLFLALVLLFVAPLAGGAAPLIGVGAAQAATVSKISVSGNQQVDAQTVISIIPVKVGENATPALLSSATAALYKTGFFKTVSVTQSGGIVFVKVSENPTIAAVLFQGNQRFSDAELLTMVQVAAHGAYSPDRLQSDVDSIKAAYAHAGYKNVTVNAQTALAEGGRTRITFVINEGNRTGIAAINFTGNHAFNAGTLKTVIRTKETGWLSWLLHDDSYDEQQLEIDKQLVRMYYANHGYPDAQVTSAVAEFDPKRNGYFVTYSIVEGDHYTFGPSSVETSIPDLKTAALQGTIKTNQGGSYSQNDLQKTASDMAFAATSEGFPFADVRPRIDRDMTNHRLNVTYLVDNGPRVYVERINITGNQKTRDFVIRRELEFSEGDPFNQALLARDKDAIQGLGFFKSVDITTEPGSAPDKVVVDVAVVEQSTGDYGITAGYSTADGILGEISLTERNFLGRGQYVRAAVGASSNGRTYDFSFTEPRFMGLKLSTGVDLYHHIVSQNESSYYGLTTTGGQFRLGMPLTENMSGNIFVGAEQKGYSVAFDDGSGNLWPASQVVSDGDVKHRAFVGYNLNYNTLDDQKHPTTGLVAVLSQSYSGWDYNYLKTDAKARYFIPLGETGMVASIKGQAGVINELDGTGVPATEAYKLSSTLVRGFESAGIGSRLNSQSTTCGSAQNQTCPYVDGELLGETAYAGLSAEVQFPIPMIPESYGLSGAVWADSAWIDGTPSFTSGSGGTGSVDPGSTDNPFKASVGGSVIWDSPFGPLRGDFGYVLSKASSDKTQVVQITLQTLL